MRYCWYTEVIAFNIYGTQSYKDIIKDCVFKIYIKPFLYVQEKNGLYAYMKTLNKKFYDVKTEEEININTTIPNKKLLPKMHIVSFSPICEIHFRIIKNKIYTYNNEECNKASNSDLKILNTMKNQYISILLHIIKKYKLKIKYLWYIILDDNWWFTNFNKNYWFTKFSKNYWFTNFNKNYWFANF